MKQKQKMEKVGFIFECSRDGADFKVARYFLQRLNSNIEMVPRFLDNAERLLVECGPVASQLLKTCERVVIMWDLMPPWESKKPCRRKDRKRAFKSLTDAGVPPEQVTLLCVEQELECWLMADRHALEKVIGELKHPHPVGQIPDYKRPDRDIQRPKSELISLFQRELGKTRKYLDRSHALRLARAVEDVTRLKRSDSFRRFAEKVARVTL